MAIQSYRDLKVYQLSYALAMDVFELTRKFPREELYSLTDQIRRSSRSVAANIVEGWAKRSYENIFKRQLTDSYGSCHEVRLWLDFALDCRYITQDEHDRLASRYEELAKMIYRLCDNWTTFQ
jgi:four helix bundle protein